MADLRDPLPHSSHILMSAACSGNVEVVLQLLSNVPALESDKNGYTALHYAAVNGHARVVQGIVARGFKVDAKDNLGYTALHLAASRGHLDVVQILLSVSRAINSQDRVHGNTAVHEAAWNGFSQTLHELVAAKANVNAINSAGFSALHLAAQNGHNESARILLFAGCSPDHKNSYGDTPLHTAARYGHAGVTQILISAKCAVNETNKNGDTALHIAAAQKQKKITKLLLDAGIDIKMLNNQKESALIIARRKDYEEVVNLISRVQVSSPGRRVSKTAATDLTKPSALSSDKKKWTSIFKKNRSKDKFPAAVMPVYESIPAYADERRMDAAPAAMESAPGDAVYASQHYHAPKLQSRAPALDTTYSSMTMSPMESSLDGTKTIRGILSRYTPVQGVQYFRDLAGNIRQGPVGYVPTADGSEPVQQYTPQHTSPDPACYPSQFANSSFRAAGQVIGGYNTLHPDYVRKRDHLSYLRSRPAAAGFAGPSPAALPANRQLPAFCPSYMDQSGRPWPVAYQTMASGRHPAVYAKHPAAVGLNPNDHSEMSVSGDGGRPVYRSRSDETLSTVSSRPSFHHHRIRHPEKKPHRKGAGKTRAIIENRPSIDDAMAVSGGECADVSPGVELPAHNGAVSEPLSKCSYVDSSSNPDSGYGGASTAGPPRPPPAPRSESSSVLSGSSGDVMGSGKAPTLGSSCRSNSVASLCNSL